MADLITFLDKQDYTNPAQKINEIGVEKVFQASDFNQLKNGINVLNKKIKFTILKNLFDKTIITSGFYVNQSDGSLIADAAWFTSDYIPVEPSTSYSANFGGFFALFDVNKNFISGGLASPNILTTTASTKFLRISNPNENIDTFQVEKGTTSTEYVPYGYLIPQSAIMPTTEKQITWTKKIVRIGGNIGVDCDFTDIKACLDSISNASFYNRFIVWIANGTYDFSVKAYPYLGFKNFVRIIGQSKAGVKIINRKDAFSDNNAVFDIAGYQEAIEYASIENLTLISYNGKGPVHIDSDISFLAEGGLAECINLECINENTSEMSHYQVSGACGLRAGQKVIFKNCTGNGIFWAHDSAPHINPTMGCELTLENCQFPYTNIADVYTYSKNKFKMHNCKTNYIKFVLANVLGNSRGYTEWSWEWDFASNDVGYIYGEIVGRPDPNQAFWDDAFGGRFGITDSSIHNYCKNNTASTIPVGTLVQLDTNFNEIQVKPWVNGKLLYGITLDTIPAGSYGVVQYSGLLLMNANGTTAIAVGDAVELNSSGVVVKYTTGYKIGYAVQALASGTGKIRIEFKQ